MAKRKADIAIDSKDSKKVKQTPGVQAVARSNLLVDSDSESDSETGGAELVPEFKVNKEYAARFEHNKKREELVKRRCLYLLLKLVHIEERCN